MLSLTKRGENLATQISSDTNGIYRLVAYMNMCKKPLEFEEAEEFCGSRRVVEQAIEKGYIQDEDHRDEHYPGLRRRNL